MDNEKQQRWTFKKKANIVLQLLKNEYEQQIRAMKEKIGDLVLELEERKNLQTLLDSKEMTS